MNVTSPVQTLVEYEPFEIEYPESDGKPMGETGIHVRVILDTFGTLDDYFQSTPDVYVAANMFFYYRKGNPHRFVAPDVFVVKGVRKYDRRTYRLWEEAIVPSVVFEITSQSTSTEDIEEKYELYQELGVSEYFLFDPLDEYLSAPLQGFALTRGKYQRMKADASGALLSRALGLKLRREESHLRLLVAATGEQLLRRAEMAERARVESERARVESERARVESERARVESERARVESERARVAEAEVERLRAELARLRGE